MEIKIEVPEEELKEMVLNVVAKRYYADYSEDRHNVNRIVAECVREIIYKDKERIVEMIVSRASRECRNKAVKKMLEEL